MSSTANVMRRAAEKVCRNAVPFQRPVSLRAVPFLRTAGFDVAGAEG
jgi:hypothetical protein